MNPIIRAFDAKQEVIAGERAVISKINTDAIDRYNTVIDPAGMTFRNYLANPVVLCNHGDANDGMPIGRCMWARYVKAEKAIMAKTQFFEDEFSDGLFQLAQQRVMNAYSVRIIPDWPKCGSPTADEIKKRPELVDCWIMFRSTDLAEYSIVNVPGNPEALAVAVSRGLSIPDSLMRELGKPRVAPAPIPIPEPQLPRLVGRTLSEVAAAGVQSLRRTLPLEARRQAQDRLDLLRGKV